MIRKVIGNIVVNPTFGDRLEEVANRGPVWIAATPTNRAAAERWGKAHALPGEYEGVTTFLVSPEQSPEEWCVDVLPTVDMHFGAYDDRPATYDAVDVWGIEPSTVLVDLLAQNGYSHITRLPQGFRAGRGAQAV